MYFSTTDHYFDDTSGSRKCETNIETDDCLICLEINDQTGVSCIRLHNLYFSKLCSCDGWVHEYCLDIWYINNKKCPICICDMSKNETNINQITTGNDENQTLIGRVFIFLKKYNFYLVIKVILLICFIYKLTNIIHCF